MVALPSPFPTPEAPDSFLIHEEMLLRVDRAELERRFRFRYLPVPVFTEARVQKRIAHQIERAFHHPDRWPEDRESFEERLFLGEFHHEAIAQGGLAPCALKRMADAKGWGLVAMEDFDIGQYLGEYTGIVSARPLWREPPDPYTFRYPWNFRHLGCLPWKVWTCAAEQGSLMRFLNHARHANARAHHVIHGGFVRLIVYTTRRIRRGEELTLHYGDRYWRQDPEAINSRQSA